MTQDWIRDLHSIFGFTWYQTASLAFSFITSPWLAEAVKQIPNLLALRADGSVAWRFETRTIGCLMFRF